MNFANSTHQEATVRKRWTWEDSIHPWTPFSAASVDHRHVFARATFAVAVIFQKSEPPSSVSTPDSFPASSRTRLNPSTLSSPSICSNPDFWQSSRAQSPRSPCFFFCRVRRLPNSSPCTPVPPVSLWSIQRMYCHLLQSWIPSFSIILFLSSLFSKLCPIFLFFCLSYIFSAKVLSFIMLLNFSSKLRQNRLATIIEIIVHLFQPSFVIQRFDYLSSRCVCTGGRPFLLKIDRQFKIYMIF